MWYESFYYGEYEEEEDNFDGKLEEVLQVGDEIWLVGYVEFEWWVLVFEEQDCCYGIYQNDVEIFVDYEQQVWG